MIDHLCLLQAIVAPNRLPSERCAVTRFQSRVRRTYCTTGPMVPTGDSTLKKSIAREDLEKLVVAEAAGEWGCEDLTGVTIEACDTGIFGRNWTVTRLQNEDLPAAEHTVHKIVERLAQRYDLKAE